MRIPTLLLLALGTTISQAQTRVFTVTGLRSGALVYGDGSRGFHCSSDYSTPELATWDPSTETLIDAVRLPGQTYMSSVSADGSMVVTVRYLGGPSYAEIRTPEGALVARQLLENRWDDPNRLPPPVITADNQYLIFRSFYTEGTSWRKLNGTTVRHLPGTLVEIASGLGAYKPDGEGKPRFVNLADGRPVTMPFALDDVFVPLGGRDGWMVSHYERSYTAHRLSDGLARPISLGPNDAFVGIATGGRVVLYRGEKGKITIVDLQKGTEKDRISCPLFNEEVPPRLSPDGTGVLIDITQNRRSLVNLDGTKPTLVHHRRSIYNLGIDDTNVPFLYHSESTLTFRDFTGRAVRSHALRKDDLTSVQGLSGDGRVALVRRANALYRMDPKVGTPVKWTDIAGDGEYVLARDGKSATEWCYGDMSYKYRYIDDKGNASVVKLPTTTSYLIAPLPNGRVL